MLTNDQMKPNRFAKLALGRKLYRRMQEAWDSGGFVRVGTATRYSDYYARHREMIKLGKSGSIYAQCRGKHWDCLDFCSFWFGTLPEKRKLRKAAS